VQDSQPSQKFVDMSFFGKIVFVGKLIIFLCTFGFAFPLILND
jgi:hypothetical protein